MFWLIFTKKAQQAEKDEEEEKAKLATLHMKYWRRMDYDPLKFKRIMDGFYTVAVKETINEYGTIVGGAYFCTRNQLIDADVHQHNNADPLPKSLHGATFVVCSNGVLHVYFEYWGMEGRPPLPV